MTDPQQTSTPDTDSQNRIAAARAAGLPGDILVMAEEATSDALRLLARRSAGDALLARDQPAYALEQYEAALFIDPDDPASRQKKVDCMTRMQVAAAKKPEGSQPRHVLLFSGHVVDAPQRAEPRFPSTKVEAATQRIEAALDDLAVGPGDVALTQGAAGGDLIFAEASLKRGVRLQLLLPLPEPEFIEKSILTSADGEDWRARYLAVKAQLRDLPRVAPAELGAVPPGVDLWERCNRWLLYTALAYGMKKVSVLALWNGNAGDGRGGTHHMMEEVRRRAGRVVWIDSRLL